MASERVLLESVTELARPIVERVVWCTVTTVAPDGAPRSRLMHPVWWWDAEGGALDRPYVVKRKTR